MKKILSAIDRVSRFIGKTVSYIMFLVVAIVCYEVLMRYIFHRPTLWASEAMIFCCGFVYVLGSAWTLLDDRHVKIDILSEKLSPRGKRLMNVITFSFFALYMLMMLREGGRFAWESIELAETSGSPWDPPVYPLKIAFVVGILLLILQGTSKFIRDLYFVITGKEI